jgi:hypothetical protein
MCLHVIVSHASTRNNKDIASPGYSILLYQSKEHPKDTIAFFHTCSVQPAVSLTFDYLFSVFCFSASRTSISLTGSPFLRLTPSMYLFATFSLSANSPRSSSSSCGFVSNHSSVGELRRGTVHETKRVGQSLELGKVRIRVIHTTVNGTQKGSSSSISNPVNRSCGDADPEDFLRISSENPKDSATGKSADMVKV